MTTELVRVLGFEALDFQPHPTGIGEYRAYLDFPNGYGVSVICGRGSFANAGEFEVAVMTSNGGICYDTPITDDVLGHLLPDQVSEVMRQVQELPPRT